MLSVFVNVFVQEQRAKSHSDSTVWLGHFIYICTSDSQYRFLSDSAQCLVPSVHFLSHTII